jgi:hypothetical protein
LDKYNEQNPITYHTDLRKYQEEWSKHERQNVMIGNTAIDFTSTVSRKNLFSQLNKPQVKDVHRSSFLWFMDFLKSKHRYIFRAKAAIYRRKLTRDPYCSEMNLYGNYFLDCVFSIYKKDYFKSLSYSNGDRLVFYELPSLKYEMFKPAGSAPYGFEKFYYSEMFSIDAMRRKAQLVQLGHFKVSNVIMRAV